MGYLKQNFPSVSLKALNVAARQSIRKDILDTLRFSQSLVLESSFDGPNLKYDVVAKAMEIMTPHGKPIKDRSRNFCDTIYCLSQSECMKASRFLNGTCKIKIVHYHAGLAEHQKNYVQKT